MDLYPVLWLGLYLLLPVQATSNHHPHPIAVSAPHGSYICPEGANVTLECAQSGAKAHPMSHMKHAWLFTSHADQHCHARLQRSSRGNHSLVYEAHETSFSVTLLDLVQADQGRYCCLALDVVQNTKHKPVVQHAGHSYILLTIIPRRNHSLTCSMIDPKPQQDSLAAGMATAACIMGILCLPLILVLVYRQRRAPGSRRAHELVRMDSEAQGHENPVFMAGSPQPKTRTVSQILSRQTSETGRHLLADPGTPMSPNGHVDVFFPAQEPIPEASDFMQV